MRKILIFIALLPAGSLSYAQKSKEKPAIDTSTFNKWPKMGPYALSNNGNYAAYVIDNSPLSRSTLVIQSTAGDWKKEFADAKCEITSDSKYAVIHLAGDSLCLYTLGTDQKEYLTHVAESKLRVFHDEDWLACQINNPEKELVLHNLVTGAARRYQGVNRFEFSENGQTLIMQAEDHHDSTVIHKLDLLDMRDGNLSPVWQGEGVPRRIVISSSGKELAFFIRSIQHGIPVTELWSYREGATKARLLVDENTQGITTNLGVSPEQLIFSKDGSRIFFKLVEEHLPEPKADAVKVDIWNYKDGGLQSGQPTGPRLFEAVVSIEDGKLIRLQQDDDVFFGAQYDGEFNEGTLLMLKYKRVGADANEWYWNPNARASIFLVNTKDGSRKLAKENSAPIGDIVYTISPDSRWLVYYDQEQHAYVSYDQQKDISRNLTGTIPVSWVNKYKEDGGGHICTTPTPGLLPPFFIPVGIASWQNDGTIMIYDENDIWQLDPSGRKPPVNLTNGYGRRNHIRFRFALEYSGASVTRRNLESSKWLLAAFDTEGKYSGFYRLPKGSIRDPEKLVMGPYSFGEDVFKGKNAAIWIIHRESAAEAPNYFITHDLKTFTPLSDLQPERQYNWLSAELHHWRTPDGTVAAGILYKPENFDPQKKYPVIFNYYENVSDELYFFQWLKPLGYLASLDIPYFVSQGYLVFTPDIHYKMGATARSVTDCVVSAAKYIAKLPFVDGKKMGIRGLSFGGYETYVLITHSHLFAAAVPYSGPCDWVSYYGGISKGGGRFRGSSNQPFAETCQSRIGATLWQRPDLFIQNSPIFQAGRVTTPTLIVHGEQDDNVRFEQAIEFYTALRRLGKKVWMLQYEDADHGLTKEIDIQDMAMRLTQFFDHYLKDAPPPKWMTEGVPARLKGIETGLEQDLSGKRP